MSFHRNSAFNWPQQRLIEVTPDPTPEVKVAAGPPLEHWHHDLNTVDILLDQEPPDIDRARRLLDDVMREIYRELR